MPEGWKYAIKRHAWEIQPVDIQAIAKHMKKCEAGLCQRIGQKLTQMEIEMKTEDIIKKYAPLAMELNELSKRLPEGDAIVKGLLDGSLSQQAAIALMDKNERWKWETKRRQQADEIRNQIPRFAQWWMNRESADRVYFVAGDVMHDKVSINEILRGQSIWDSPCGMGYRRFKDGAVVACSGGTLHLRNLEDPLEAHYIGRMTDEEWERFASGDEQQVSKYLPKHLVWRKGGKNDK